MNKNITIEFDYSEFNLLDEKITFGETIGNNITIYPNNHKNVTELAKTIIHETTHADLNTNIYTQKEEVFCKLQELRHTKDKYDISDIRRIIFEVKSNPSYNGLKWRDKNGI